jgi:hypothetical protein
MHVALPTVFLAYCIIVCQYTFLLSNRTDSPNQRETHETGGILVIVLWMSCFLSPRFSGLFVVVKAGRRSTENEQYFTSLISKCMSFVCYSF